MQLLPLLQLFITNTTDTRLQSQLFQLKKGDTGQRVLKRLKKNFQQVFQQQKCFTSIFFYWEEKKIIKQLNKIFLKKLSYSSRYTTLWAIKYTFTHLKDQKTYKVCSYPTMELKYKSRNRNIAEKFPKYLKVKQCTSK